MAGGEFARGWRVLLGSALGVGLGIAGLLTYNSGLFLAELGEDIGLSRTIYGGAFFASTLALAFGMPAVGAAVDRYGPRSIAAAGALALAAGFAALSQVDSVVAYVCVMVALGFFAGLSSPVPFTRAVAASFNQARGLALGLTQTGIGVAAAVIPPVVAIVIAQYSWRSGYLVLAGIAALGFFTALIALPRDQIGAVGPDHDGDTFATVRHSRTYHLQLAAFSTMALAFAGLLSHFVPMLRDSGMPLERAGGLAGLVGVSVIVTRVMVGWLSDRIEPAWLGAASCVVCSTGCLLLALGGNVFAPAAAVALGAAMGAEADLIGILTARAFPLGALSRAYSRQYAAFMVAGGMSPLWMGYLTDVTGDYGLALYLCAGTLLVPTLLFVRLAVPRTDLRAPSSN